MKKNSKFTMQFSRFKNWLRFKKKMWQLWWANAPKYQKDLEKGNYYMRRGAIYQVGQPFTVQDKFGKRLRYIDNLFFDFKKNKISHKFSNKPIKGYTEKFEDRR